MKIFRVKEHYQKEFDEYVLGPHELGNRVGYMTWGEMGPGRVKTLSPGHGHEEIITIVGGEAALEGGPIARTGDTFYLPSGDGVTLTAGPEGCTYLSAGAHVEDHGH